MLSNEIKNIKIRLAQKEDQENIISLLNLVFRNQQHSKNERNDKLWHWKYEENVFGKGIIIIAENDKRIIASSSLWPWDFSCCGQELKALQPCETVVHPDFQGRGLFYNLNRARLNFSKKENIDFLFNFPNQNSLNGYLSFGWHFMGKITWWVKPLKPVRILSGLFSNGQVVPVAIDNEYSLSQELLCDISNECQAFNGFIKIKRSPIFYNWRYSNHPSRKYGMVFVAEGPNTCAGIFTITQKGKNREMVVVDIIGPPRFMPELFKKLIQAGKKSEVDFIAVMNNNFYNTQELWKYGFIRKKMKNMVVLPLKIGLAEKLTNFSNWNMVASLHDSI
jgi:predicted N-acetyltransferase YhbS